MKKIEELILKFKATETVKFISYEDYSNLMITSHSTRIEGSTLSIEEVQLLIETGISPKKELVYSNMTLDHYNAFKYVMEQSSKQSQITLDLLQKIASLVMKHTGDTINTILGATDSTKGDLRRLNVTAGNVRFMNYDKVPKAINQLIVELNDNLKKNLTWKEQLELSFYAHYELVNIHPFLDGNGRVSRLLMNYIQNYYSLPLTIVYAEDKDMYIKALNEVRNTESHQPFYDFMFSQYKKFLMSELEKSHKANNNRFQGFRR